MSFPVLGKNENSKNQAFKRALYMGYCRHLFKGNSELLNAIKQPFVARHHFHPGLLQKNDEHLHGSYFITKIDMELGKSIGLRDVDRVAGINSFYAVPNYSIKNIMDYVGLKETESVVTGSDIVLTSRMSSASKQTMRMMQAAADENDSVVKKKKRDFDERVENDTTARAYLSENQENFVKRLFTDLEIKEKENETLQMSLNEMEAKLAETSMKLREEMDKYDDLIEKQRELNSNRSGLERSLILNSVWHKNNPTACTHLFGFHSFDEYKVYCGCLFQGLTLEYGTSRADNITDWEKLTMAKLRMRRGVSLLLLSLIFCRNRTSIGVYVTYGAARWGEAGENLSILELTKEYLDYERPQIFTDADHQTVAALVDGKDFMTADPKQNSAIKKGMWSDKVAHAGVRICTWSTPSGLTFEHTPAFMARATETAIVSLWGSYWDVVPLSKVPEVKPVSLKFIKTEKYEEKCPILNKVIGENRNKGAGEEDMLDENEIYEDNNEAEFDNDEAGEAEVVLKKMPSIDLVNRGTNFIDETRKRILKLKSGRKYSTDNITKMNSGLLKAGPNESTSRKLEQLIVHEALHQAYVKGDLKKCLLSYYLQFMHTLRADMLLHLKGEAGQNMPPYLLTRLAKIPPGFTVLADRGFYFDAPSYPNVNAQITPHFLTSREQFESDEVSRDLITCRLRWSSEAIFSRVTDHEILTDVVPYSHFSILASAIHWGHAHANLMQPFNSPVNY